MLLTLRGRRGFWGLLGVWLLTLGVFLPFPARDHDRVGQQLVSWPP